MDSCFGSIGTIRTCMLPAAYVVPPYSQRPPYDCKIAIPDSVCSVATGRWLQMKTTPRNCTHAIVLRSMHDPVAMGKLHVRIDLLVVSYAPVNERLASISTQI